MPAAPETSRGVRSSASPRNQGHSRAPSSPGQFAQAPPARRAAQGRSRTRPQRLGNRAAPPEVSRRLLRVRMVQSRRDPTGVPATTGHGRARLGRHPQRRRQPLVSPSPRQRGQPRQEVPGDALSQGFFRRSPLPRVRPRRSPRRCGGARPVERADARGRADPETTSKTVRLPSGLGEPGKAASAAPTSSPSTGGAHAHRS
jgi:hypothetical protein